ncbi:LysR family transcriptional regulator [Baekduia soli]|uniref:LysR family transcriptional regulator n=1 Tax=Baekduia soli TaxID=496014 RepID=A0A5B8U004_9ACTN|nr:LysR family transcriptional regulator [Baekduia soli]QEC46317.1 LysR family transcriptional regulator [Baekduia soli]
MTLQQLEYFLAALEEGSFTAAAERLLLAQPSLSEQVRRLEAELGVALFARVGRGIKPTAAAEALRPHAEAALSAVEHAREAVVAQRELQGGIATFGTFGTARWYPGTQIVMAFRRRHPKVRVRLVGQNSSEVAAAVRAGDLEAGLIALPIDDTGLEVRPIMQDEIVYLSADAARLRHPVTIEDLAAAPLILTDASYGLEDPTRRQLYELAQREGVKIEPAIDVEDVETAIELASRGMGDALVARGVLLSLGRRVPRRLGWVPFAEPLHDTFAFINRRGARLSPAAREFMALAEEGMQAMARELGTTPPRQHPPGG